MCPDLVFSGAARARQRPLWMDVATHEPPRQEKTAGQRVADLRSDCAPPGTRTPNLLIKSRRLGVPGCAAGCQVVLFWLVTFGGACREMPAHAAWCRSSRARLGRGWV